MTNRPATTPLRNPHRRPSVLFALALALVGLLTLISPAAGAQNAPSTPTSLRVAAATATSVTLAWDPSIVIGNKTVVAYDLYQDVVKVGAVTQLDLLNYTFVGLNCGTSYKLGVAGRDAQNHVSAVTYLVAATSPCFDTQPPTTPAGVSQIAKTATSATVSWSPSSDNTGVVGYGAYQGGVRIAQTALTSYTFSSLSCGTSTTVGVDAYDAAGNRSTQTSFVVSTSPCNDTQPPTAPTGLTQTGNTATSISVTWNPSTDNVGVAYYSVRSNGTQVGTATQTSYTLTGLVCATSYTITVAAYDSTGNHAISAGVILATAACPPPSGGSDTTPPSVPTNEQVASTTQTSVTVSWSASTDNVGVAGYGAYFEGTRVGQTTQISYTFSGLACGKSYTLGIDAYDAAGNRSSVAYATLIASTGACSDAQPPTAPTNVALLNRTGTSISLTWTASTDNVGVVGYGVYKAGASAGSTSTTSYTVTGLACGTSYTIGVDAYDGSGNHSSQATVMLATAACGDTQPPSAPTSLLASSVSQTGATLSWVASTDNLGVTGYDVFANGTKVGTTATVTSYLLSTLTCGSTNSLGVEAFDAAGNRSTRTLVNAVTTACSTGSASLYVSPTGNDANPCLQVSPCASFNRAYQLALPGQTVQVAGGTYGQQVIAERPALRGLNGCDPYGEWGAATTAKCVTFVPAAGATVSMTGGLEVHGSSLWFNGTRSGAIDADKSAYNWRVRGYVDVEVNSGGTLQDHVIFNGIYTKAFTASDSDKTMFRQMSIGGQVASGAGGSCIWLDMDDGQPVGSFESKVLQRNVAVPTNVVLDQDYIHDTDRDAAGAAASCHFGGMIIVNVNGMTIRRSVFSQLWVYAIEVKLDTGSVKATNMTIENNWFGCNVEGSYAVGNRTTCSSQDPVQFSGGSGETWQNILIRYNSFGQSGSVGCYATSCGTSSNFRLVGNTGDAPGGSFCGSSVTSTYNAWVGTTCGSGDVSVPGFSSLYKSTATGAEDFHLVTGSPAINAADGSSYPAIDRDGKARPAGGRPDAGADEAA